MRSNVRLASFALLVTVTAACGGGTDGAGSGAPASSPEASPEALSPAQAQAAADAINLRAGDLPGFESAAAEAEDPAEPDEDDPLLACVGAGGAEGIVETSSPTFSQGQFPQTQVVSRVDVYAEPARALSDVEAYQGEKATQCVADFFKESAGAGAPPGTTFSEPQVTRSTPAAQGTDASVAFQITTTLSTQGQQVPVVFRLFAYAKDRTQVAMTVTQLGEQAPEVEADALFAQLVSRATAAV